MADAKTYANLSNSSFNGTSGNQTFPGKIALNAVSGTANGVVNSSSPSTLPGKLSGSDNEDGNYCGASGTNSTRTVVFTVLPTYTNDVLVYYNGTSYILLKPNPLVNDPSYVYWSTANSRYEIPGFNANNLYVYFKQNTHSSFSFTYGWKDAAGLLGTTAVYSVTATAPLPMKLIYFGAELNNKAVSLKWMTTNEYNIEHYEIERSTDTRVWTRLVSKLPTNSYSTISKYYGNDIMGTEETIYYRIKEIDTDGAIYFSNVVSVSSNSQKLSFTAYPNPIKQNEVLNIMVENHSRQPITIQLTDITGKILTEGNYTPEGNHIPYQLDEIPAGIYVVTLTNETISETMRLIIK